MALVAPVSAQAIDVATPNQMAAYCLEASSALLSDGCHMLK